MLRLNRFRRNKDDEPFVSWQVIVLMLIMCMTMFVGNDAESSPIVQPDTLFGKVVAVTDGDTLTILDGSNTQVVIRLFGIDSPETSCHAQKPSVYDDACVEHGQSFGKTAKRSLAELVFGKEVVVILQPGNTYGRSIGTVWVGNINANLEQVKRGMAWMYRQYAKRGMTASEYVEMEEAEHHAQERMLGLWSVPERIPPWEYRHH